MGSEGKVIIISTDEHFGKRIAALLKEGNYSLGGACLNNAAGIRTVRRISPDFLIIDDDMPGLRGFDLACLFAEEESMPIILLAAAISPAMLNKAKKSPFFVVLRKPLGEETLSLAMENLLHVCAYAARVRKSLSARQREKQLNLAKGMLMAVKNFTEAEAHQALLKESMKRGEPLEKTAARFLEECSAKGGGG